MLAPERLVGERLAAHVAGLCFADLPASAVAAAKVFVLDTLGVAVSGSSAAGMAALRGAAARWGAGDEATVWGTGLRVPATTATFLNATHAHNQEFDCLHEQAVVHLMATLLPATLAWAERQGGVSGQALITALAAGADVSAGLGLASTAEFRFFRPAVAGGFGALAGCAKLAGLSAGAMAGAFGLHYAQTSGTMQPHTEGNVALPMQIGFNARAALAAADMAGAGLAGPVDVFEGRYGYFRLIEGSWEIDRIWAFLGKDFQIGKLSHKPYPAGRATHGGIEGILALREKHAIRPEAVASVEVIGPPLINRLVGRADVPEPNAFYARLCMAFMGAKALLHGRVDIADCRGDALTDAATHELAARISMRMDDNPDANALAPQRVVITMQDGAVHEWRCAAMLAHPSRPLTREQHLAKFFRCWEFADVPLGRERAERLMEMVDRLEGVEDVRAVTGLLAPAG